MTSAGLLDMTQDTKTDCTEPQVVFVVDDDPQVREAIELLLDSVDLKAETFESAQAFLQSFDPTRSGCLVLDVRMPGMSGLEMQRKLIADGIDIPILLLTAHAEVPIAVETLKAGALDFIEKPYSPQALLDQIQKALAEDSRRRTKRLRLADVETRLTRLSEREQDILRMLVKGGSAKSIAEDLGISEKTVDFHRRNLLEKMQVGTVVELGRMVEFIESMRPANGGAG